MLDHARMFHPAHPRRWIPLLVMALFVGCEAAPHEAKLAPVPAGHHAKAVGTARLAQDRPATGAPADVPSRLVRPADIPPPNAPADILVQLPDPRTVRGVIEKERDEELAQINDRPGVPEDKDRSRQEVGLTFNRRLQGVQEKLAAIHRDKQFELGLMDAIRRTLQHSYGLAVQGYYPAIDTAHIVEAEAQFDAVYFANYNYNKQDRPTASQLTSTLTDTRTFQTGVRKLLSTGTQMQVSYQITRNWTNLVFATLNPAYFNDLALEFRQPFLRGFGLDYNRAQIEIRKLDRAISVDRMQKEVRETIHSVEQAYWGLFQARRAVSVSARLLTDLETLLEWLNQRKEAGYDVYGVQLKLTLSRIEQRRAEFIRRCNEVKNTEDALKTLMNDPQLTLAEDIEIIPIDTALLEPVTLDELGEISAALSNRSELREARHTIEQAELAVGVAKNQAMPKLDAMFRYLIDGLGTHWDRAFSQMADNDFNEYVVGIEFEWPIGNRGPEAALRRARLQQAQAIAAQKAQVENVIREVRQAIRELQTNYEQIGPSLRASLASRDQLRATKARQERLDPPSLQVELDAHEALAGSRDALLQVMANYNVALSNLERRKGTLLQYNNIVIRGADDERYLAPYKPILSP